MPTDRQLDELINILQKLYDRLTRQPPRQQERQQQQRQQPRREDPQEARRERAEQRILYRRLDSNFEEQKQLFKQLPSVLEKSTSRVYTAYGRSLLDKITGQGTYRQLVNQLPQRLQQSFLESGSEIANKIGQQLTGTAEDFVRLQDGLNNIGKILDIAEEYFKLSSEERAANYEKYQEKLEKLGYSIEFFGNSIDEARKNAREFVRSTTEALETVSRSVQRDQQLRGALTRFFSGFSITAAGIVAKGVVDAVARYGTTVQDVLSVQARMTGMSIEELAAVQAQYRQEILATGGNFQQFNQWLSDSAWNLRLYTGSLAEGARVAASNVRMSLIFGSTTDEAAQLLQQQNEQFQRWNRLFGMTADEFIDFNNMLLSNTTIQGQLYLISQNQRKAYLEGIRTNYELLRTFGLLDDEAKSVLQTFQSMGVMSPRERLRQAYRIQAFAGMMGIGQVGAEAAQLLIRGLRTPEEQQRFAELTRQITEQTAALGQQGFGTELVLRSVLERMDLDRYFGPQGEFSKLATRQLLKIDDGVREQQTQTNIFGSLDSTTNKIATEVTRIAVSTADIATTNRQLFITTAFLAATIGKFGLAGSRSIGGLIRGGADRLRQTRIGRTRFGRTVGGGLSVLGGFIGLEAGDAAIDRAERQLVQRAARSGSSRLVQAGARFLGGGLLRSIPIVGSILGAAINIPKIAQAWEAGNIGSAITYGVTGLLGPIGLAAEAALESFGIISTRLEETAEQLRKNAQQAQELQQRAERELEGEKLQVFSRMLEEFKKDNEISRNELKKLVKFVETQVEETKRQTEVIEKNKPKFTGASIIDSDLMSD